MSSVTNTELHQLPNGATVIFDPQDHIYTYNDYVLPSITTLIQNVYGNMYSAVNPELLQRAADYGTAVHQEIQDLVELRDEILGSIDPSIAQHQEVKNYFMFVEPIYKIQPIMMEKVVLLYNEEGNPVAAGRFDMFGLVADKPTLIDLKTTSTIHRQSVTAQLNLYLKGARQCGYLSDYANVDLGVVHLHGETSRYVPITVLGDNFCKQFLPS
ncbi:MAG: hypothetical protein J6S67_23475 [Methanobrevibacter sp.]|nr:hypothetical protein [Methanobrevibacter sp.]